MKFKSQKGSVALFVLIALLFYMGFLLLLYANNLNKIQTISEKIELIKSIYEKNINNIDDVYNRRFAKNDNVQPTIKDIPTMVIINHINGIENNITNLKDTYEEYGPTGGRAEYFMFDKEFTSFKEAIDYANQNDLYGNRLLKVNAYGNNGLVTNEEMNIDIKKGTLVKNETELITALGMTEDIYVCMNNNIVCTDKLNIDNVTHTLDLNNFNLSYTTGNNSFSFITFGSNANITLIDLSTEQNGAVISNMLEETNKSDGNKRESSIVTIENYGNLTIKSGKVISTYIQTMLAARDGTTVDGAAATIRNYGTVNLDGGKIECNVKTQACTYITSHDSKAWARGIRNYGIVNLNAGEMNITAYANIIQANSVSAKGKTYAYAYGIQNEGGTVNNTNQVKFNLSATADTNATNSQTKDEQEIIEREKTASE